MKNVNTVSVKLWGTVVGYLHQEDNGIVGFQYDEEFLKKTYEYALKFKELKRSVEEKYFEETFNPKYIRYIFDEVLKPRIEDDNGRRFELDEALRNVRKVNIVTHSQIAVRKSKA